MIIKSPHLLEHANFEKLRGTLKLLNEELTLNDSKKLLVNFPEVAEEDLTFKLKEMKERLSIYFDISKEETSEMIEKTPFVLKSNV